MRTDDSSYPYKDNPLRFEDVALAASIRWAVSENSVLKYLKAMFTDAGDALTHLQQNQERAPNAFWETL